MTLDKFYSTELGQYVLHWEQQQYDRLVSECFGYNAIQLGAAGQNFLRNNRIGFQIIGDPHGHLLKTMTNDKRCKVQLDYEILPFETESVDLVVLPHTLEVSDDPHAVLREVSRILIPGGRLIIGGFNLASRWGLRYAMQRFGAKPFLPGNQFMSVAQVRDWLHLLSFRTDRGAFGRYGSWRRPPKNKENAWIEKAGDRWWPQCGASYVLSSVKVVPGGKLVGKALKKHYFFVNPGRRAGVQTKNGLE